MAQTTFIRYSNCSTLAVGCFLYTNSSLTNPVPDGYHSDSNVCYTVSGGNGYISSISICPTPTPTITPSPINYTVTIFGRAQSTPQETGYVYYRIDAGSWTNLNSFNSAVCSSLGSISVPNGSSISIEVRTLGDNPIFFFANDNSSTCPSGVPSYCLLNNVVITGNRNIAFNARVDRSGFYVEC